MSVPTPGYIHIHRENAKKAIETYDPDILTMIQNIQEKRLIIKQLYGLSLQNTVSWFNGEEWRDFLKSYDAQAVDDDFQKRESSLKKQIFDCLENAQKMINTAADLDIWGEMTVIDNLLDQMKKQNDIDVDQVLAEYDTNIKTIQKQIAKLMSFREWASLQKAATLGTRSRDTTIRTFSYELLQQMQKTQTLVESNRGRLENFINQYMNGQKNLSNVTDISKNSGNISGEAVFQRFRRQLLVSFSNNLLSRVIFETAGFIVKNEQRVAFINPLKAQGITFSHIGTKAEQGHAAKKTMIGKGDSKISYSIDSSGGRIEFLLSTKTYLQEKDFATKIAQANTQKVTSSSLQISGGSGGSILRLLAADFIQDKARTGLGNYYYHIHHKDINNTNETMEGLSPTILLNQKKAIILLGFVLTFGSSSATEFVHFFDINGVLFSIPKIIKFFLESQNKNTNFEQYFTLTSEAFKSDYSQESVFSQINAIEGSKERWAALDKLKIIMHLHIGKMAMAAANSIIVSKPTT